MSAISHMVAQPRALPVLVVLRVLEQDNKLQIAPDVCVKKSHVGQKYHCRLFKV